jgi:hypothetical protein
MDFEAEKQFGLKGVEAQMQLELDRMRQLRRAASARLKRREV